MLVLALREKKKDFLIALSKSVNLIKELIDKSLHSLLSKKNVAKIWTILKNRFQHIFSMSIIKIFLDVCAIRLLDYTNIIIYISRYQIAFDKLFSFLNNES